MRKMYLVSLACLAALALAGCSKGGDGAPEKKAASEQKAAVGNESKAANGKDAKTPGFVGVIKGATLDALKSKTIGEAIDGYQYFETRDWNESRVANGRVMVVFYGRLKESSISDVDKRAGVVARGMDIKFVIGRDGAYNIESISRYDTLRDGKLQGYAVADFGTVLPKIYRNERPVF